MLWIDVTAVGVLPVTTPLIPVAVLITGGSMELIVFHRCFGFSLFRIGSLILVSLSLLYPFSP